MLGFGYIKMFGKVVFEVYGILYGRFEIIFF